MPIYEYQCAQCGHHVEVLQQLSDEPLRRCEACGEDSLNKLISATSFQLKGSGWYKASPTEKRSQGTSSAVVAQDKTKPEKTETASSSSSTEAGTTTVNDTGNSTDKKDA